MKHAIIILSSFIFSSVVGAVVVSDPLLSTGRKADPTSKTLAEIRQAERRRIPIEVLLRAEESYTIGEPMMVSVIVTNLFDQPLAMNRRMLVNHPALEGELYFWIVGPNKKLWQIQRRVTPLPIRAEDFSVLKRGMSMERTIDLADFYGLTEPGNYKIYVAYRNDMDQPIGSLMAWKGQAWSVPLIIHIE